MVCCPCCPKVFCYVCFCPSAFLFKGTASLTWTNTNRHYDWGLEFMSHFVTGLWAGWDGCHMSHVRSTSFCLKQNAQQYPDSKRLSAFNAGLQIRLVNFWLRFKKQCWFNYIYHFKNNTTVVELVEDRYFVLNVEFPYLDPTMYGLCDMFFLNMSWILGLSILSIKSPIPRFWARLMVIEWITDIC